MSCAHCNADDGARHHYTCPLVSTGGRRLDEIRAERLGIERHLARVLLMVNDAATVAMGHACALNRKSFLSDDDLAELEAAWRTFRRFVRRYNP